MTHSAGYLFKSLGIMVSAFSLTLIPPMLVGFWYEEMAAYVFAATLMGTFGSGLLLWFPVRHNKHEPLAKDGFLLVFLFWLTLCLVGAVPFMLSEQPNISWIDAIFESVSGLTATGATILTGLEYLPKAMLFYRQQLQFLGGMGIILLGIAILPALNIGGMQLFRAEFTGTSKENKLTPKLAQTAKAIWMIYCGLTLFCTIAYWAAGMELFDAISISFGTVSTGGFVTHDQSIGYFQSPTIQLIAVVFMLLGGTNFYLHFISFHSGSVKAYLHDAEFKTFFTIIFASTLIVTILLWRHHVFEKPSQTLIESLFHVTSLCTTTGFSSSFYQGWPLFAPILLLLLGVIGGCAGSTSGGMKMIRLLLLWKQGLRELKRLVHPHAHYIIKFGRTPLSDRVISAIWGFIATYFALFGLFLILLLATDLNFTTAYSATAASLSNIGPGLAEVAKNYQDINDSAKLIISAAMLIGRLEIFTVLVLLTPTFWRN